MLRLRTSLVTPFTLLLLVRLGAVPVAAYATTGKRRFVTQTR